MILNTNKLSSFLSSVFSEWAFSLSFCVLSAFIFPPAGFPDRSGLLLSEYQILPNRP